MFQKYEESLELLFRNFQSYVIWSTSYFGGVIPEKLKDYFREKIDDIKYNIQIFIIASIITS